ncbi:PH domain-containing protein [Bacillus sp. UMB0893]|uniref:PH domain-containing protein n=1 Tax=Bacillus sp. UMB0893 TaxID=2066053 RepID=UPI000C7900E5|nr:PH domain-containing protein [Bacillus sp. UMB0893]PLR66762.1 hypothetical protein CYJ36_15945 [Bacillus sp. UMB0893]
MIETIPEPQRQISPYAIQVWRISSIISHIVTIIIFVAIIFMQQHFDWYGWIGHASYVLLAITALHSIYGIFYYPALMQRTWRYEVDAEHIHLKHGALEKTHTIIPMTKVQYVNTNQGVILRKYGLATITIGTTASSHEIPAILEEEAEMLRSQIAIFAKVTGSE